MNDYFEFKKKIQELVKAWNTIIKPGIEESGQYGETNTRKYLIDPILDALNWVDDGSKKIIDNEFSVKHKTGTGSADYALKVNGNPKILIEAKDVAKIKDLENGYDTVHGIKRTYPRQLSNYCHDLNFQGFDIKFAILTNGKEWIVYNMKYADISSEREIIFRLDLEELDKDENIKNLWALEYNDICGDYHNLREIIQNLHDFRFNIDKKAVQQLLECKDLLSNSIFNDYEKNKRGIKDQIDDILEDKEQVNGMPIFQEIPEDERLTYFIKEASSSVINKILFIRILEDKNFLTPKLTKRKIEEWRDFFGYKDYDEIMNLFRESCRISEKTYNGGLFRLNPYDKIEYNPNIIKRIIDILGDINFREIGSDIIGRIYEIYLGQVLKVESEIRGKKRTKYQTDNKERKKLGQYYTPKFVVDFIVQNTLGKLIEGKKPEEVSKIRILDPACGSGSFLINAYDVLAEYFENWNNGILKKIEEKNRKKGAKITNYSDTGAIPKYKNILLKDNLHGVDLNDLSVQICEINLWLRALEWDKKLIKLNKNILYGNSLITGVENEEELSKYKYELEDIKKRQHQIKEYYDEDDIPSSGIKRLEALERNLKFIKNKVNKKLNENLKDYFDDHISSVNPFNWKVEFPEVTQEGGFDLIIGNPPYVFSRKLISEEEKKYFSNFFETFEYQPDLYVLFLEKSIKLLKEDGYFGMIVPNAWFGNLRTKKIRNLVLKNTSITDIVYCPKETFGIGVETAIVILKNKGEKKSNDEINVYEYDNTFTLNKLGNVSQTALINSSDGKLHFRLTKSNLNIIEQVEKDTKPLEYFCDITRGVNAYDKYRGQAEDIIKGRKYHAEYKKDESYIPELKGKNVHWYYYSWDGKSWIKYGNWLAAPREPKFFTGNRVILRQIPSNRLVATIIKEDFCIDQTVFIAKPKEDSRTIYFILGIINSSLMAFYFKYKNEEVDEVFPKVKLEQFKNLPIKEDKNQELLVDVVEKMLLLQVKLVEINRYFDKSLSNQSITEPKSCNFGRYFDGYELYNIKRETFSKINEIEANLLSVDVKEEGHNLEIFVAISEKSKKQLQKDIKAITLTIEDEDIRRFLFFSIKKALYDKGRKGFGKGNILKLIKKIYVSYYVTNAKMNIQKIKDVMNEFNHNTKDLWWKDESKKEKFSSLTEIEEEIEKTDKKIDEMIYGLYGITEEEKKIIEDSLK